MPALTGLVICSVTFPEAVFGLLHRNKLAMVVIDLYQR